MDALAALTSLELWICPGVRALASSLWWLTQLCSLGHALRRCHELPVCGLPASAACFPTCSISA